MRYSEHPFVEANIDGVGVNVVPCYNVKKGEWKSAADRSTFHTEFMSEKLTGLMKDDIRVLKCFMEKNIALRKQSTDCPYNRDFMPMVIF